MNSNKIRKLFQKANSSETELEEVELTHCKKYFYHHHKSTNTKVKQVTIQNKQSTINALMKWLRKEFGFTDNMLKGSLAEGQKKT